MTEKQYRAELAKTKRFDVVRIRWRDSSRIALGWDGVDEYVAAMDEHMQAVEESTGYFVGSNDALVMVSLNYGPSTEGRLRRETVCDAMVIPHEVVRSFEIIAAASSLDREPIK